GDVGDRAEVKHVYPARVRRVDELVAPGRRGVERQVHVPVRVEHEARVLLADAVVRDVHEIEVRARAAPARGTVDVPDLLAVGVGVELLHEGDVHDAVRVDADGGRVVPEAVVDDRGRLQRELRRRGGDEQGGRGQCGGGPSHERYSVRGKRVRVGAPKVP